MFTPLASIQLGDQQLSNTFDDSGLMPPNQHGRSVDRRGSLQAGHSGGYLVFARVVKLTREDGRPASRQLARRHPANRQWEAVKPPVDVPARATLAELRPGNLGAACTLESSIGESRGTYAKAETTAGRLRHTSIWTLQNSGNTGPTLNIHSDREKLCRALNLGNTVSPKQ